MSATPQRALIAGAGIGGLAAAFAVACAGWGVDLYDQASELSEVGAGLQLGPNATRILCEWGLESELRRVAAAPEQLVVRNAQNGCVLGTMPLGRELRARYGAPYFTLHRADLQALLLRVVAALPHVRVHLGERVESYVEAGNAVAIKTGASAGVTGDALIGADGLHSAVRQALLRDGAPRAIGDCAYRALLESAKLPAPARANQVTAWLGPDLHVVQYPVRAGAAMNLVLLVHGARRTSADGWDHRVDPGEPEAAVRRMCAPLRDLVTAVPNVSLNPDPWGMWLLADRPPVGAAGAMARGRVALAGDAAHPMRPYLAQGAGMAIEDAAELGRVFTDAGDDIPAALQRYAQARWRRCARVQARSERNSIIFHARGLLRVGRDLSLRLLGERLMDVPWLYSAG